MGDIRKYATMKRWGKSVGREGMSEAAIKAVEEFDGSYKGAMELAGKMKAIAQASTSDDYWSEKVSRGYHQQLWIAGNHNQKILEQSQANDELERRVNNV